MAVNKVIKSDGTTIIDITGTTATPSDVVEGKRFFAADGTEQTGTAVMGGGSAISVVDTTDSHGGTIRTITAVDLSADTVTAATLLQGYTAHDRLGNAVVGTASGGDGKNAQIALGVGRVANSSYAEVSGQSIEVEKTGTYDVYWCGWRTSTSGTSGSQLYIDGSAYGSAQTSFSSFSNAQTVHLSNVSLTQGQTITVRARSRNTSYYMYIYNLTIIEA